MDLPEFTLFVIRKGERLDERRPVFNGGLDEVPQVRVEDVLKASDDML